MRNVVLSSICAAAIGLSTVSGAFAQASATDKPAAPANNQTNVTGPATAGSDTGMNAKNEMKTKKKTSKKMKKDDMEKKS